MKIDKFKKYKRGDFNLTNDHLFAQQKLLKLRNYIIQKNNLFNLINQSSQKKIFGGSDLINSDALREQVQNTIDENIKGETMFESDDTSYTFLNDEAMKSISNMIIYAFDNYQDLLKPSEKQLLLDLIETDSALVKEFQNYQNINNDKFFGLKNKEIVQRNLLKIQKGLFDLQVKTIFNKLKQVKQIIHRMVESQPENKQLEVDINPLLEVIEKKIEALNKYIESQDAVKDNITNPDVIIEDVDITENPDVITDKDTIRTKLEEKVIENIPEYTEFEKLGNLLIPSIDLESDLDTWLSKSIPVTELINILGDDYKETIQSYASDSSDVKMSDLPNILIRKNKTD